MSNDDKDDDITVVHLTVVNMHLQNQKFTAKN